MKNNAAMSDAEVDRLYSEFRTKVTGGPAKTLGFYIHLALMASAATAVVWYQAWNVLWAVTTLVVALAVSSIKSFTWNWTEEKLKKDVEDGRIERAEYWDYLSILVDWTVAFAVFVMITLAVFALADGYGLPRPAVWLCVAGIHTIPMFYPRDQYNWGCYAFWEQWTLLAVIALSAFLPIGPAWGIAAQAAIAFVSLPLDFRWTRPSILRKIEEYRRNYEVARAAGRFPPPTPRQNPTMDLVWKTFSKLRFDWFPFAITLVCLVAGIAWTLFLHRPKYIPLGLLAAVLGHLSQSMIEDPKAMEPGEQAKRKIDVDLTWDFFLFRGTVVLVSIGVASVAVLWLADRDAPLLVALALLAVGSCNAFSYVSHVDSNNFKADPMFAIVYPLALASVCALRISLPYLFWWECLLPLPIFAYLVPTLRWFFPRSGLRGAEREAAIADMPRRLKADIRTAAEKDRDDKIAKRRLRNERRLARFRRSRGEQ